MRTGDVMTSFQCNVSLKSPGTGNGVPPTEVITGLVAMVTGLVARKLAMLPPTGRVFLLSVKF